MEIEVKDDDMEADIHSTTIDSRISSCTPQLSRTGASTSHAPPPRTPQPASLDQWTAIMTAL
ncbi:unnamed protein product, partial [Ilex paraguariensis]